MGYHLTWLGILLWTSIIGSMYLYHEGCKVLTLNKICLLCFIDRITGCSPSAQPGLGKVLTSHRKLLYMHHVVNDLIQFDPNDLSQMIKPHAEVNRILLDDFAIGDRKIISSLFVAQFPFLCKCDWCFFILSKFDIYPDPDWLLLKRVFIFHCLFPI